MSTTLTQILLGQVIQIALATASVRFLKDILEVVPNRSFGYGQLIPDFLGYTAIYEKFQYLNFLIANVRLRRRRCIDWI